MADAAWFVGQAVPMPCPVPLVVDAMAIFPTLIQNGRFITHEEAMIPVTTPALVGAFGVYETILVRYGHYVALREHLERLLVSAAGAQLVLAVDLDALSQWCYDLVTANGPEGLVRVIAVDLGNPQADVFLYQMTASAPSLVEYEVGVRVVVYHGERALPAVKSFNTLVPGLARKAAVAAGAHDALLVDGDGNITEGTNCNVFAVIGDVLMAPPASAILAGTVMDRIIHLAAALELPFQRRPLPLAGVPRWDEAFLTSTRRGVLPICRIDEQDLGLPGPVTRRLMQAYRTWEDHELSA